MNIYAFDVDDTLEVSNGPIKISQFIRLKGEGHALGLCGNWGVFVQRIVGWHYLISFFGPLDPALSKAGMLANLKAFLPPMERYVMVGNDIDGAGNVAPDRSAASSAGWEFIREKDFKEGLD